MLQSQAEPDAKLFAATTLKGKVCLLLLLPCVQEGPSQLTERIRVDYLRPVDTGTRHRTSCAPVTDIGSLEAICSRAQANKSSALCLFGASSYTDEGLERCSSSRRFLARQRS